MPSTGYVIQNNTETTHSQVWQAPKMFKLFAFFFFIDKCWYKMQVKSTNICSQVLRILRCFPLDRNMLASIRCYYMHENKANISTTPREREREIEAYNKTCLLIYHQQHEEQQKQWNNNPQKWFDFRILDSQADNAPVSSRYWWATIVWWTAIGLHFTKTRKILLVQFC